MKIREFLTASYRHVLGLGGLGAVVVGVGGAFGWQAGAIVAGLPFAGFWLYGEARSAAHEWRMRLG